MVTTTIVSIIVVSVVVVVCCCAVQLNRMWRNSEVYAQLYHNQPLHDQHREDELKEEGRMKHTKTSSSTVSTLSTTHWSAAPLSTAHTITTPPFSPADVKDSHLTASPFWGMDSSGKIGQARQVIQGQTFTPPISSYPDTPLPDPPVLILDDEKEKTEVKSD